jgi:hypothetical protein
MNSPESLVAIQDEVVLVVLMGMEAQQGIGWTRSAVTK